ncbi:N-acetylgalactosamine-N,N '-diacetylbacillosaminyl-diphospho-undecaprenol 4-alpha-N-acetylgalactosaminyltransferase [Dorea longicatena]|uniref:N-acetylgalactosamine-N,N '-diacetylbacillosaminyl-diphospho-undecaprenol 4-alpha-N-acetylgalactosaminyltransferase n=1 Tax=Dorea longicatena TaxID=88431 RepID=A0A564TAA2_9FIRM|nr:glycosyltransferase [Dorea longicatena]VUX04340.1 N-acetylgalactosamine-N,N '-diacetylbacillosaminyl-diphospho-undecaprenol 4-alpha-N-acetylgalactosaminyltransferase [Dorea longicatena]
MKKVLFVINTLGCAGAEMALIELLKSLDEKEYELSLYVLMGQGEMIDKIPENVKLLNDHYCKDSVLSKQGKQAMMKTVWSSFGENGNVFGKFAYIVRTFSAMRRTGKFQPDKILWRVISDGSPRFEETYDLAVAYLEGGSTYYVADHVKAKKKAVFIHIDYESSGYTKGMDRNCFDKIDRIFTVSDEVKKHFLNVYPKYQDKVKVFHNIINQDEIRRKAEEGTGFEDHFDGVRLLTVGRLTYQKAYDIAIDAMKLIKDRGYKVRWYILGEGSERPALEKKVKELGLEKEFLMPGAASDPFPYYKQADIYVHATRFEGKSIAIQEAQTLGCAIIASDCNGNREQIVQGKDGLLCQLDPESIAEAVISLVEDRDKRIRLGNAAKEKDIVHKGEIKLLLELMQ